MEGGHRDALCCVGAGDITTLNSVVHSVDLAITRVDYSVDYLKHHDE